MASTDSLDDLMSQIKDQEKDVQVAVDRCALSNHATKGACYLTDDCAAVYGDKAISLWMH